MLPPRRILVGVDFSAGSRVAVELAGRLAAHVGGQLIAVHAIDPRLTSPVRHDPAIAQEAAAELTAFVEDVAPWARATTHVFEGPPPLVLAHTAEREGADITVVGMRGLSAREGVASGLTTEHLFRDTRLPLLIVPGTWTAPHPERSDLRGTGPIVLGLDFTSNALPAACVAPHLATLLGAALEVVHVVPDLPVAPRWQHRADAAIAAEKITARDTLDVLMRRTRTSVATTTLVERGEVADVLTHLAAPTATRRPWLLLGRYTLDGPAGGAGIVARRILAATGSPVLVWVESD